MKKIALEYLQNLITQDTKKQELDIIQFIIKCVKNSKEKPRTVTKEPEVEWLPFFEKLWELYPRKDGKQTAKRTFEKKVAGLTEEQMRTKCNAIYVAQKRYISWLQETVTETKFIKMYSTWLNSEVQDSPLKNGK